MSGLTAHHQTVTLKSRPPPYAILIPWLSTRRGSTKLGLIQGSVDLLPIIRSCQGDLEYPTYDGSNIWCCCSDRFVHIRDSDESPHDLPVPNHIHGLITPNGTCCTQTSARAMSENEAANDAPVAEAASSQPNTEAEVTAKRSLSTSDLTDQDGARHSTPPPPVIASTTAQDQAEQTIDAKSAEEIANADTATGSAGASYGTRSRNRTSGARPNYAEDKDLDADVEMNGAHHPESSNKKAHQAPTSNSGVSEEKGATASSSTRRGGFAAINGNPPSNAHHVSSSKDGSSGTSTPSGGNATSQHATGTSKKRKQPGSHVTASSASSGGHSSSRARATASTYTDSNMMSFERSGSYLKNGKLKADDGTVLSVNGERKPLMDGCRGLELDC